MQTNNIIHNHELIQIKSYDDYLYFENDIKLETCANYNYYFLYEKEADWDILDINDKKSYI